MKLGLRNRVLVEVGKGSYLIGHLQVLHIIDLTSREHVGGFDRTFTHLLVDDSLVDLLFNGIRHGRRLIVLVTFLLVLLAPWSKNNCELDLG